MSEVLYDDGNLKLDQHGLTIRRYYFPLGTAKKLSYKDIHAIEVRQLGPSTGKGRIWGTSSPGHWYPLDFNRPRRSVVVVLHTGDSIKPCVTPADPERFVGLLRSRGGHG